LRKYVEGKLAPRLEEGMFEHARKNNTKGVNEDLKYQLLKCGLQVASVARRHWRHTRTSKMGDNGWHGNELAARQESSSRFVPF
jgi:hypothetical protein